MALKTMRSYGRNLWQNRDMAETPSRPTPPYGGFSAFWSFIEELHQRGPAPQAFEPSVFGGRSNAARYETLVALKFFGLMDKERRPTPAGRSLIEHPDEGTLHVLLKEHYADVIALGLDTATPEQLNEVLASMGAKEGSTQRKARTFFLHAAQKAGLSIGTHLKASPPSSRPATRRPKPKDNQPKPELRQSTDLRTRYIEMLMDKAQAQEKPDDGLLDRIEAALKEAESTKD
ncbi:MAG: hypothetical protein QOG87_1904 [Actinomycetota bacterium]|jgi:hypothetical protein